ncbi:sigma-70 family RNA polymerase sigma factor [Micromonospora sp. WMMD1102]|uniref:RNA polymerase sigma factor n=1 Tax=Micromonospora sp. WMMD1102 TaxID=3016105 RepID=UPI002415880E|nr:sigma-70 family RNA polymerase sigma factor [Micromonospora sp. WMMD1102]MDG4788864.1 sigma-70 family RNA polymerase sigma factor [Micromonospora sp. WMMD1102]
MRASEPDEEHLLRRVARADLDAFDELYRRTSPWLAIRLRRRCADDGIVAEVLQDTYLTVWRAAGSFAALRPSGGADAPGGSAAGWIWTIAARRLVDALRRRARQPDVLPAESLPVPNSPAAEDVALDRTIGNELGAAVDRLAPELRAVLSAMVIDGLTVRETSALLGLPEGTVKSRARRARNVLREALS